MPKPDADKKKRRTYALTDAEDNLLFLIGEANRLGKSGTIAEHIWMEAKRMKISLDDPAMQLLLKKRHEQKKK